MSVEGKKNWQPNPDITPEELERMSIDVRERITVARIGLLLKHPFFGNMATRLTVKDGTSWLPTAATDGRNLYYNAEFFNAMDNAEIEFVIAHEILHCVFDHLGRRDNRDPKLYNIAADYIVNNLLVRDRIGEKPKLIDCFQDFKYEGWTSEQVYDDLFEQADKIDLDQLGELLDEHLDLEDGDGGGGDKNCDGSGGGKPTYSKEELKAIKDEIKASMLSAAQAAGAGNVPGDVQRLINEFTNPIMDWREILQTQIQSVMKNDYSFSRPSRKGQGVAILPGLMNEETIDICVALDTSGSIGDEMLKDFMGEIQGIMDQYNDYKVTVWCFDTKVYNVAEFTSHDGELTEYQAVGGGGTDFMANWDFMKEEGIEPKKFIMFTDGYCWGSWGDENYCDTVFVLHSNYDKDTEAPFGVTTRYEDSQ